MASLETSNKSALHLQSRFQSHSGNKVEESNAHSGIEQIDPVLVEELPYKISKATQRSVLLTNYDAASCFNRIIPNLAALASRIF